jgi:hypothetical protein
MDKDNALSVRRQCKLLSLHRSTAYYELAPPSEEDLAFRMSRCTRFRLTS